MHTHQQRWNDVPLVQDASAACRHGGRQTVRDATAFLQLCVQRQLKAHNFSATSRAHPLKQRGDNIATLRVIGSGSSDDTRQRSTQRLLDQAARCRKPSDQARQQRLQVLSRQLAGNRPEQGDDAGFDAILSRSRESAAQRSTTCITCAPDASRHRKRTEHRRLPPM
jgi:hypothetical protein